MTEDNNINYTGSKMTENNKITESSKFEITEGSKLVYDYIAVISSYFNDRNGAYGILVNYVQKLNNYGFSFLDDKIGDLGDFSKRPLSFYPQTAVPILRKIRESKKIKNKDGLPLTLSYLEQLLFCIHVPSLMSSTSPHKESVIAGNFRLEPRYGCADGKNYRR